jgi:hypothetical protein
MKTYYSDKSWLFAKMSVIIYCIHPAIIYCIKDVFSPHITFIVTIIIATIISYHYVILKKYVITKTRE